MAEKPISTLRDGLRDRLLSIDDEFDLARDRREQGHKAVDEKYRIETAQLSEERDLVAKLLVLEDRRFGGPPSVPSDKTAPVVPLADYVVQVARATGPKTKDEFKALAEEAGYAADGRRLHATLVNVTRTGRLQQLEDGRYGATPATTLNLKSKAANDRPF